MNHHRRVTEIHELVAEHFELSVEELLSRRKTKEVVHARHAAVYLARKHTAFSYPALGELFRRHHASMFHSYNRAKDLLVTDPAFAVSLGIVEARLKRIKHLEAA